LGSSIKIFQAREAQSAMQWLTKAFVKMALLRGNSKGENKILRVLHLSVLHKQVVTEVMNSRRHAAEAALAAVLDGL
jgi:hypothetical protein